MKTAKKVVYTIRKCEKRSNKCEDEEHQHKNVCCFSPSILLLIACLHIAQTLALFLCTIQILWHFWVVLLRAIELNARLSNKCDTCTHTKLFLFTFSIENLLMEKIIYQKLSIRWHLSYTFDRIISRIH